MDHFDGNTVQKRLYVEGIFDAVTTLRNILKKPALDHVDAIMD
jgi:hypothetical protein